MKTTSQWPTCAAVVFVTLAFTFLETDVQASLQYIGDPFLDSDGDSYTLEDGDLDDGNASISPAEPDLDNDGIYDAHDEDQSDPLIPGLIPDMGLSVGGPYTINLGSDLELSLTISTPGLTSAVNLLFDFGQDDVPDAYAANSGLGPFTEVIYAAHLAAFGIAGLGTHEFDVAAYGYGIAGTDGSGAYLDELVTKTVSFTVVPEPSALALTGMGVVCLLLCALRRRNSPDRQRTAILYQQ